MEVVVEESGRWERFKVSLSDAGRENYGVASNYIFRTEWWKEGVYKTVLRRRRRHGESM